MLLAPLLCAALAWQEPPPTPPGAPWQRVATFGRLLSQKLTGLVVLTRTQGNGEQYYNPFTGVLQPGGDAYGRGGGAPPSELGSGAMPGGAGSGGAAGGSNPLVNSVESSFATTLRSMLAEQAGGLVRTSTEHVPGIGSVVSLALHLPIEAVPPEPGKPTAADPAAQQSDDDAEWEAAENPGRAATERASQRWLRAAGATTLPTRFVFAKGSLEALRTTVVEVIGRFGPRVELARGEQLAIVVLVEAQPTPTQLLGASQVPVLGSVPVIHHLFRSANGPASGAPTGAGGVGGGDAGGGVGGAAGGGVGGGPGGAPGGMGGGDPTSVTTFGYGGITYVAPQLPEATRLVFRVDAAALAELRAGRLTAAQFAARVVTSDH
ncbi:MAG: hypothetical protein JNL90_06850 [Planctomycetes bacterium]|nr:hypothetical protein [Planctomycetota bacterium]